MGDHEKDSLEFERLEQLAADIRSKLFEIEELFANLKAEHRFAHALLPANSQPRGSAPTSLQILASFPVRGENGFHRQEYDKEGRPFRWTAGESFRFHGRIDRSLPLAFRLVISDWGSGRTVERIVIDGMEQSVAVTRQGGDLVYKGVMDPSDGTDFLIECTSEITIADDGRELGVPFRELQLDSKAD